MYFPLAALLCWSLRIEKKASGIGWVILIALIWGIFMEYMQRSMQLGRTFSWYDELANFIGVIVGVILYWSVTKKISFQK